MDGKRVCYNVCILEGLKELFINPDYRKVDRLTPIHGIWLFLGWGIIFLSLSLLVGPTMTERLEQGEIWVDILAVQLPLFLFCCIFMVIAHMKFSDLKLKALRLAEWMAAPLMSIAALIGAVAVLIPVVMSQLILTPDAFSESLKQVKVLQEAIIPGSGAELAFNLVLLAVIPAVVEEFFFRGLVMDAFMKFGPIWAILISSVSFGISHQMPLRIPSLILVGILLAMFKYRTGKLTASIAMHVIYNAILITLSYFANGAIDGDMLSFIGI